MATPCCPVQGVDVEMSFRADGLCSEQWGKEVSETSAGEDEMGEVGGAEDLGDLDKELGCDREKRWMDRSHDVMKVANGVMAGGCVGLLVLGCGAGLLSSRQG